MLPHLQQFARIPEREWRWLAARLRPVRLAPGEALTRAGDVADRFGVIGTGVMRKLHVTPAGKSVVRGFGGPGEVVGAYVSLLTAQPSHLSVEAVTDCELFAMVWRDMEALYARHACWQELGRRVAESMLVEREARAHELLTLSASDRYLRFVASHKAVLPALSGRDIASYLGITPVSLSRIRRRLRDKINAGER